MKMFRAISATVLLIAPCAIWAVAADVVDVEGERTATVGMKDLVRITGKGIAGAQIKAKVEGPGKLQATNRIRRVKDGMPIIGVAITEFMVKPTMPGIIRVTVSVKNPNDAKPIVKKYSIEVK